jgi:hypothetical protein
MEVKSHIFYDDIKQTSTVTVHSLVASVPGERSNGIQLMNASALHGKNNIAHDVSF